MSFLREAEDDLMGDVAEDRETDFASPIEGEEIAGAAAGGFDELEANKIGARGHEPAARPRKRNRSSYCDDDMPAVPFASIVKVLVKKAPWTYTAPWRKESQRACSGSGFLLGTNRVIVTGAHVVHRATSVIVQAQVGAQAKYAARVVCIGREIDLAILTIDDDAFWMDKTPLEVRLHCSASV
jgi:S1-C subfamily serine protease